MYLATDGNVVAGQDFSLGLSSEDQALHRAEVEGLVAVARALCRCRCHSSGAAHVLADCQSAAEVVRGGATPLLSSRAAVLFAGLRPSLREAGPAYLEVPTL